MFDLKWYAFINVILRFRATMDDDTNVRILVHKCKFSMNNVELKKWCDNNKISGTHLAVMVVYVGMLKMYFNIHNTSDITITKCLMRSKGGK